MSTVATDFASKLEPLVELAERAGISSEHLLPYGFDLAKIDLAAVDTSAPQRARYVVVTEPPPRLSARGKRRLLSASFRGWHLRVLVQL